jgi:hypothetical protein
LAVLLRNAAEQMLKLRQLFEDRAEVIARPVRIELMLRKVAAPLRRIATRASTSTVR